MKKFSLEKLTTPILAFITILAVFIIFWKIMSNQINPENKDIIIYLLGVLSGVLTMIISYYFGSSNQFNENTDKNEKNND
jgi:hypothetical protein